MFSHVDGLLCTTGYLREGIFDASWYSRACPLSCAWLYELATHKAIQFPRLTAVAVYETMIVDGSELYRAVSWRPYYHLRKEFESNGISLAGVMRVP